MRDSMPVLSRRHLLGLVAGSGATVLFLGACDRSSAPNSAPAIRRVGYLTSVPYRDERTRQLVDRLRGYGWIEGQNVTFEWRFPDSTSAAPAAATEMVRAPFDVIVALGSASANAL